MNWFIHCFRNAFNFEGRAHRTEFWMFSLFAFIFGFLIGILDAVMQTEGVLVGLFYLVMLFPSIAVTIRRLHDTGRSGWWLLIGLIPFAGLILLIFYVADSEAGTNRFGPNPKEGAIEGAPA